MNPHQQNSSSNVAPDHRGFARLALAGRGLAPAGRAWAERLTARFAASLAQRSRSLVSFLDLRVEMLIVGWIVVMVPLALGKVLLGIGQARSAPDILFLLLPFLLTVAAPVVGYRVAAGSFPKGLLSAQPAIRLCRIGAWRALDVVETRRNPAFGPTGFMASLIVGILLNVPFRTFEFMLGVPAIGPAAPGWARTFLTVMTVDIVVMNFFYMVAFVMALRSVPLFPRMMVFAWVVDISMQLIIADRVSHAPGLPVEVATALHAMLHGNIDKVLISVAVWLPYLILSERVNVTFRQRVRQPAMAA